MSRIWRISLVTIAALVALPVISMVVFIPAAAAFACPFCYGFTESKPGVFIERSTSQAAVAEFHSNLAEAETLTSEFYQSDIEATPVILACATAACDRRLGGKGAKAQSFGARFIHVSPSGWNVTILAHELAHIRLHSLVGLQPLASGALPAWFDEGMAVLVSRDERYLRVSDNGQITCLFQSEGDLPTSNQAWGRDAGAKVRPIYEMAACRVLSWLEGNGGLDAVVSLAQRLRDGESFVE